MASEQPTVLVTGAGQRIGRQIGLYLAGQGFAVIFHYGQSHNGAETAAEAVRMQGKTAATISCDLEDHEAVSHLIEYAEKTIGRPLTALVNNASLFKDDQINTLTADSFNAHMAVNTLAPLLLTQSFARRLTERQQKGSVVNIIDQRVWRLNPGFMTYTISKAALWTLTQTCAQALAPNIRVNGVGPGPVLASIHQSNDDFTREARNIPLKRQVSPEEIAKAVHFLLDSPSITGQMIAVDGGQHLAWETPDQNGNQS